MNFICNDVHNLIWDVLVAIVWDCTKAKCVALKPCVLH